MLRALIKGNSSSPVLQALLVELHDFEISNDLNMWFERIASASNPANAPSGDVKRLPVSFRVRLSQRNLLHPT